MSDKIIDHLFRHQSGKMISILAKLYGLQHLAIIEDAVQDSFIRAIGAWRKGLPDNPEAWLTVTAKNRMVDLLRSSTTSKTRENLTNKIDENHIQQEVILDTEVEDVQLRMIFTACHPQLDPTEQIAFALKTISGFSTKEIASALLLKEETIKKRLQRARKFIAKKSLKFEIPQGPELEGRLDRVLEVLYVIFNEGLHSNKKELAIRKELCGEALRLSKMILKKPELRKSKMYALFALMCFHSARLDSRVNEYNELVPLSEQDRSSWYFPLIALGNEAMNKAMDLSTEYSSYHYEAAIAGEHLRAPSFEETNWKVLAKWYEELLKISDSSATQLSLAVVQLQLGDLIAAKKIIKEINVNKLAQKEYLYYATWAEYYYLNGEGAKAIEYINLALSQVKNNSEDKYLRKKCAIYSDLKRS